ncbi:MAG TPA: hypothetical protein VNH11_26600 [Pirellulales bacterium]|nr:hypothetical protein [Pirellulales bacterium]
MNFVTTKLRPALYRVRRSVEQFVVAGAEPRYSVNSANTPRRGDAPVPAAPGHRWPAAFFGDGSSHPASSASATGNCGARVSWTYVLLALGLCLRLYHYLRNPSLWHDEAALVLNVLDKSFWELLGPLQFSEAAPPLFLWLEKAVTLAFGESLYALRLLPLAASCGALVLFAFVARRTLEPAAVPWAVFLFATSDRLLWHSCEAKQYAIEVFVSVVLLAVWLGTSTWPTARRAVLLAVLAPPLLWLAYPAAFLYGGLLVALLGKTWQSRRAADGIAYALLCLTVLVAFAALLAGPVHAQRDETIVHCWDAMSQFPDWSRPMSVPGWTVRSTCDLVGYCIKPVGQWLTPLAAAGLVLCWWRGQREWCLALMTPVVLALAASSIKAYPYGGMRVMAYAAPAVTLLVAAAVPWCFERLRSRHRWAAAPLIGLLLLPALRAGYCAAWPWSRADCAAASGFVERHRRTGEIVTANHWEYLYYFRGLGADFIPIENLTTSPQAGRMWVVVTGATPADRQPCIRPFTGPEWHTQERREFERTTVLLVEHGGLAKRPARSRSQR